MSNKELATEIVMKLKKAGFIAYFAGGWVRDYVMDHPSDDIDIATNAPPEKILDLFPHTILVGLSFGVVIVVLKGHQFEVSTFRKDLEYVNGRSPEGIELADAKEDALRRDFTINGLFYDPIEEKIFDYVHGLEDIERKIIRTIGDPFERFFEDRLRMIRAIRFSARFDFPIELATQEAIFENATTLFPAVAVERIWNEFIKMVKTKRFDYALSEMHRLELLPVIFPSLKGVHLHDIRARVAVFKDFPTNAPTILYLMELFKGSSLQERLDVCNYLKLSNFDVKLVEFAHYSEQFLKEETSKNDFEKVNFYAHPYQQMCIEIFVAHLPIEKRALFLEKQAKNQERLKAHIERMVLKKPIITASILQNEGVKPGIVMGRLLKEAEKICIIQNMHSAETVLSYLKQSNDWPK